MVELEHEFTMPHSIDENWRAILDLDRLVPCVKGGSVIAPISPDHVEAEIVVLMGAMSMKFAGTVEITEQDEPAHCAVMKVRSREATGQGIAQADVTITLTERGGLIRTRAQITGKAASMGEGVIRSVLDGLIADFTDNLGRL